MPIPIPDRIIRGLPLKSRDELPPILRALQRIYVTPELNEGVFRILEERVRRGRKGGEIWDGIVVYIGVIGSEVGTGCQLRQAGGFVNHHKLIRQILGVETEFGEGKRYSMQSIKDNVGWLVG